MKFAHGFCSARRLYPLSRRYCIVSSRSSKKIVHTDVPVPMIAKGSNGEEIVIPKKKHRTPTSILEALSRTVGKDPLAPHFKYVDDPYLIPTSNLHKRTYALSKASGKKAAKWILEKHQDIMPDVTADPPIMKFDPDVNSEHIREISEGEELLKGLIDASCVAEAWEDYQKLKSEGKTISQDVKLRLLDLLCAYNSEPVEMENISDERWYWRELGQDVGKRLKRSWKDGCPADQLFEELQAEKIPAAYKSMIRGLSKYLHVEGAHSLYKEMLELQMTPDVQTFNAILSIASFLREDNEARWELITNVLQQMKDVEVAPNLNTFNAVFASLTRMSRWKRSNSLTLQTLNEMNACGIEPSLGTWSCILQVFYSNENYQNTMLYEILDQVEGKEFQVQHPIDVEFFRMAMLKCLINLKDIDLANRIDRLLNTGNHKALMGDSYKETTYYNSYFRLMCEFGMIEDIMELYERYVPNVWTPGFHIMLDVIKALDLQDGFMHLPKIWSDLVLFEYTRREDLVTPALHLMTKLKDDEQLQELFHTICKQTLEQIKEVDADPIAYRMSGNKSVILSGPIISHFIDISLNSNDLEIAWEFYETFIRKQGELTGLPSENTLFRLTEKFMKNQDSVKVMKLISTMADLALPMTKDLAKKCLEEMELSDIDRSHMSVLV